MAPLILQPTVNSIVLSVVLNAAVQNIPEQSTLLKAKEIKRKHRDAKAAAVSGKAITCCQHHNIYSAPENLHGEMLYGDSPEKEPERRRGVSVCPTDGNTGWRQISGRDSDTSVINQPRLKRRRSCVDGVSAASL